MLSHAKVFHSFNKQSLWLGLGAGDRERQSSALVDLPSQHREAEDEGAIDETVPENRGHEERQQTPDREGGTWRGRLRMKSVLPASLVEFKTPHISPHFTVGDWLGQQCASAQDRS